jgi:phosphatidylserine/phosphatidylglycerophosphate/cardiolipin synthase-like enzyme
VLLFLLLCLALAGCSFAQVPCPTVEVCFSPKGNCSAVVIREIDNAKKEILIQAYSLTLKSISMALFSAKGRGVSVMVVLETPRSGPSMNEALFLSNVGIPVRIDSIHGAAHNKVFVFDGSCVITGSNNFSRKGDEKNAENIVVIVDKKTATHFRENFNLHWAHSKDFFSRVSR